MNEFQETLRRRLLPSFEAFCQSYPPGSLSAVLVEHPGTLTKDAAIDLCPHKASNDKLDGYVADRVACRKSESTLPTSWTWRTSYSLSRDADALKRFATLAVEAGGCLRDWATGCGISPDTISTYRPLYRWLFALFDLAWARRAQFPIPAERVYLCRDRLTDAALKKAFFESHCRDNTEEERNDFTRKAKDAGIEIDLRSLADLDSLAASRQETLRQLDAEIRAAQCLGFWSALPDVARASLYAIDVLAPATSPRDQITSEACAATKTKAKGGRRIDTDPKKDKRIFDAWKTGRYPTYEALGRELQKTKHEVKTAIDRHRKRI